MDLRGQQRNFGVCWKRAKMKAKHDLDEQRKDQRKTGNPPALMLDPISASVAPLIAEQVAPLENPYDDDAPPVRKHQPTSSSTASTQPSRISESSAAATRKKQNSQQYQKKKDFSTHF